jgi:hypothetical protein
VRTHLTRMLQLRAAWKSADRLILQIRTLGQTVSVEIDPALLDIVA